ncbi:hypothetical protein SAMN04487949_1764 [Halogranum gelatinilyticum]|uniref:Uncharacterized protein n=1 Tax=Halogranum gelatinilyticum TaxID=660521 RepID=A0A1G9TGH3_9EURY|nr:hypothetical protein SAMN04487949_1764 [Halogranum gelatinilyticum]
MTDRSVLGATWILLATGVTMKVIEQGQDSALVASPALLVITAGVLNWMLAKGVTLSASGEDSDR